MCSLCNVKNKEWESDKFFGLICRTCNVPMIVLKEHKASLTDEEAQEFKKLIKIYYPDRKPRNVGMRSLPNHWHEHLIK